ncbi:hypothetical protein HMPREF3163_04225 [Actinomyces sp. HMSC08A01]|nr:hypothetical protein HMPREF3163_04225 [Actinomyces sp. HMSC08A01]
MRRYFWAIRLITAAHRVKTHAPIANQEERCEAEAKQINVAATMMNQVVSFFLMAPEYRSPVRNDDSHFWVYSKNVS